MEGPGLLVVNLKAGRALALSLAVEELTAAGIRIESTTFDLAPESLAAQVAAAKADGTNTVLVFGGDGSVGSVVNAIAGQDMVLGVIAGGTSNNFLRSLGVRPTIRGSIAAIRYGSPTTMDVGEINGHYFAHAAIMGLNVEFAHQVDRYRGVIRRLSYPLASLLVYASRRKLNLSITNGASTNLDTYQLTLLNSRVGSGETGSLRIVTCDDLRLRTLVRDLPRVFWQRHLGLPGGQEFEIADATITSTAPIDITLDGEIRTTTPARVGIRPGALRVLMPRQ